MTDNPILFGSQGTPITANGDSAAYTLSRTGRYAFDVTGTFASATVTLYVKPGGHASYYALSGGAISSAGGAVYEFAAGDTIKTTTSGATGSTSLVASLTQLGV